MYSTELQTVVVWFSESEIISSEYQVVVKTVSKRLVRKCAASKIIIQLMRQASTASQARSTLSSTMRLRKATMHEWRVTSRSVLLRVRCDVPAASDSPLLFTSYNVNYAILGIPVYKFTAATVVALDLSTLTGHMKVQRSFIMKNIINDLWTFILKFKLNEFHNYKIIKKQH